MSFARNKHRNGKTDLTYTHEWTADYCRRLRDTFYFRSQPNE